MLLRVEGLNTFYEDSHVLQGVNLSVRQGEIVGLIGRNGVGKTTTLCSIMQLTPPQSGSIRFKDWELFGQPQYLPARLGLGYVPEERRIFPDLTVRENLLIGIKGRGKRSDGWTLDKLYDLFHLLKVRDRFKGRNLSGGEQQILSIGRALMGNPELLLIDEPSEGLAPMINDRIWRILTEANRKGMSMLLVEQNLHAVLGIASRNYVMSKGTVVFEGTSEGLKANQEVINRYLKV